MIRIILAILMVMIMPEISKAAACSATIAQGSTESCSSITQHGITWTFDTNYTVGQFVNGDYWVVDPGTGVNITDIDPGRSLLTNESYTDRSINGSMINPDTRDQGYDSSGTYYTVGLNVGIGISPSTPLVLNHDESLVSIISNPLRPEHTSYVNSAAVLTCLSSAPASGSFRPGISSSTKVLHNLSSVDYSKLASLVCPITKPNITTYAGYFQMVWLDHNGGWTARYLHPSEGLPDNYYYPKEFAEAALMLHLDYTNEQKRDLLVNYIQVGIDLYTYLEAGANGWYPDGGNGNGRKWPILFAGIMLNYDPMKNIGLISGDHLYDDGYGPGNRPPTYKNFGEDAQTFYVKQFDIDLTNSVAWNPDERYVGPDPYTSAMLGMPEWGIKYAGNPEESFANWDANYRSIGSGPKVWAGTALAARIMGAKTLWNNDAHFDYMDRHMQISKDGTDPFGFSVPDQAAGYRNDTLVGVMWDTYRLDYGAIGGPAPPPVNTTKIRYRFPGGAVITEAVDN